MAQTDWEGAGSGALEGGLGGAGAGASVGFMFGGPPGAIIGGAIGAGVGIIGGAITGVLDADAERELEREIQYQQDMLDKAQRRFEANTAMAGETAKEVLTQTMTTKNAQDVAKADQVMEDASRSADAANMDPQMKADFLLKARESANKQSAASAPAFAQQALGGAMNIRGQEVQKAAMTLQSEQSQIGQELNRLGETVLPDNTAAFGQVLGTTAQLAGAAKSIQNQTKMADSYESMAAARTAATAPEVAKTVPAAPTTTPASTTPASTTPAVTAPGGTVTQPNMEMGTVPGPDTSNMFGMSPESLNAGSGIVPSQSALGGTGPILGPALPPGPMLGPAAPPISGEAFAPGATQAQIDQLRGPASIPGYGSLEDPYIMSGTDPGMMTPDQLMSSTPEPQQYGIIPKPLGPQPDAVLFPTTATGQQTQSTTYPSMQQAVQSAVASDAAAAAAATPAPLSSDFGTEAMGDPFSGDLSSAPAATPAPAIDPKVLQPGHYWQVQPNGGYMQVPYGGYASGGMAGATGPEVAVLGEEGPELVLNAKQTQELAQALGGAEPYAMGGVAGAKKKKKLPGYAGGGVAGAAKPGRSQFEMDPEEMLEYLTTMKQQMKGAL